MLYAGCRRRVTITDGTVLPELRAADADLYVHQLR